MSSAHHLEPAVAEVVFGATGARRATSVDVVQTLWSGYGSILRVGLEDHASVVVKRVRWPTQREHPRGWATSRSHERKVKSYAVEANFYQAFAPSCVTACRVPTLLAASQQDDGVLLVLEDLNEAGFGQRRAAGSPVDVQACLSWLAAFHATFLSRSPAGLWPVGTYWHLDTRPDELAAMGDTPLSRAASALDQRLSQTPFQTLVHGDAKVANFCFSASGQSVAAVDFQYVGGGCGIKDVAYFLGSCLDEEDCARFQDPLLDYYFSELSSNLGSVAPDVDREQLCRDWRALYAIAWTDFFRFLAGWSPEHWKVHRYTKQLAARVLADL